MLKTIGQIDQDALSVIAVGLFFLILMTPIPINFAIAFLIFTVVYVSSKPSEKHNITDLYIFSAFILSFLVSMSLSVDFWRSLTLAVSLVPGILIFILLRDMTLSERNWLLLSTSIVLALSAVAIHIIFESLFSRELLAKPDVLANSLNNQFLVVPNDILMLAILSPFFIFLMTKQCSNTLKLFVLLLFVGIPISIVLMQSRTALVVFLIVNTLYLFICRRRLVIRCIAGLAVVLLAMDGLMGFQLIEKLGNYSWPRLVVWESAWLMFLDSWLWGNGPYTFGILYESYLPATEFAYDEIVDKRGMKWAHNLYLETLAEKGIFGFVVALIIIGRVLYLSFPWAKCIKVELFEFKAIIFVCMIGFISAACLELSFIRLWVVVLLFFFWGLSEGLPRVLKD